MHSIQNIYNIDCNIEEFYLVVIFRYIYINVMRNRMLTRILVYCLSISLGNKIITFAAGNHFTALLVCFLFNIKLLALSIDFNICIRTLGNDDGWWYKRRVISCYFRLLFIFKPLYTTKKIFQNFNNSLQ